MTPAKPDAPKTCLVPQEGQGSRIDALLGLLVPGMGLRGRRRLLAEKRVLVNGRPARAGQLALAGDTLALLPPEGCPEKAGSAARYTVTDTAAGMETGAAIGAGDLVAAANGFFALYKPWGLNTAALAGGTGQSLEAMLENGLARQKGLKGAPILLTRLDRHTSGLVLACESPEREQWFRAAEAACGVRKSYLALVRGRPENDMVIDNLIDMADRKKSLVRAQSTPDASRHTLVRRVSEGEVLAELQAEAAPRRREGGNTVHNRRVTGHAPGGECCLVRVDIARGARHQVRAHLAHAGFPLAGDSLYGGGEPLSQAGGEGASHGGPPFYLHHALVKMEGFSAFVAPSGGLWEWVF